MDKPCCFVLSIFLCASVVFGSCGTPAQKKYPNELVRTYAELLVLHEREKIGGNTPDSLYQVKVKDFFAVRNKNEEEFQKRVADISRDDVAWRSFLTEATSLMDSIKATKPK